MVLHLMLEAGHEAFNIGKMLMLMAERRSLANLINNHHYGK